MMPPVTICVLPGEAMAVLTPNTLLPDRTRLRPSVRLPRLNCMVVLLCGVWSGPVIPTSLGVYSSCPPTAAGAVMQSTEALFALRQPARLHKRRPSAEGRRLCRRGDLLGGWQIAARSSVEDDDEAALLCPAVARNPDEAAVR